MTLGQLIKKYNGLRKQNYEQVMITDVINDLYELRARNILSKAGVPKEDW